MLSSIHYVGAMLAARLDTKSERGAAMVEYGLLVAFIALVVGIAALMLGGSISDLFTEADKSLDSAPTPTYVAPAT